MATRDVYDDGFDEDDGTVSGRCPECTGRLLVDGGEISCTDCGLVIEEQRFERAPERSFADDETNPERTGAPLTPARHDRGLSSEIGYGGDANGNPLSARARRRVARMRREHNRARWGSKAEQNLAHACGEIHRLTSALELPWSITEEACTLYRQAQQHDLVRGRSIEIICAGCVYAACRCRGATRTLQDVARVAQCTLAEVRLGYGVLNAELDLDTQVIGVHDRLPKIASAHGVSSSVQSRAFELAALAEDTGIANGRNPRGVAAACLYLAGEEHNAGYTQSGLATAADVSAATVGHRTAELRDACGDDNHIEPSSHD